MALAYVNGEAFTSGETVTPTKLNALVTGMSVTMAANKVLGTTTAGAATEIDKMDVGSLSAVVTTQFDKTDTTLADVTGLSVDVAAGVTYSFTAEIFATQDYAGNCKAAIGGTATATSFVAGSLYTSTTSAAVNFIGSSPSALGSAVDFGNSGTTGQSLWINGTITVNAAGTLTVQFAKRTSSGTTSSVLVGSSLRVWKVA